MIFNKNTAIVSAALLLSSANASTTRNIAADKQDAVLRRLAQLEEIVTKQGEMLRQQASTIDGLHEERRLQQGCAPTFNAALGQCVYSAPSRFEASSAFLNPVTFVNDVTIFGREDEDATEFRVEGNVDAVFAQDENLVVATETLFSDNVFVGDDTRRSSRPSSRDEASLFVDGNLAVLGESYFKDDVAIDEDAELNVEGDLKVEEDAEIEGDLDLGGDFNQ